MCRSRMRCVCLYQIAAAAEGDTAACVLTTQTCDCSCEWLWAPCKRGLGEHAACKATTACKKCPPAVSARNTARTVLTPLTDRDSIATAGLESEVQFDACSCHCLQDLHTQLNKSRSGTQHVQQRTPRTSGMMCTSARARMMPPLNARSNRGNTASADLNRSVSIPNNAAPLRMTKMDATLQGNEQWCAVACVKRAV
jgi:hypothetical protein